MLILTRRVGEALKIGDDVTITVLSVRGQQVRVGIDAPKTVSVHREEIYEKIANGESPVTNEEFGGNPVTNEEFDILDD